ncbi:hypothetical protein ABZX74_15395 [Streptomyces olivaceoviridis]|uniref:hypothetical protein n=1 Tax=Streptomyces olivaceoviridis TaxID=1921 RepID=UPI0033A9D29C
MSLDAQDWVWEHSASKNTPRLVLLAIADKASGSDVSAYAGTTFLMRRANASRTAVIKAVDTLLESGELEIVEGKKGPHGETRYRIPGAKGHRRKGGTESVPVQNPDRSGKKTPGGTDSVPGGSTFRTPRGTESEPHNAVNTDTPVRTQKRGETVSRRTQHAPEDHGPTPIEVDGFHLNDSMRAWALRTFGPAIDIDYETAQFIDHFRAQAVRRSNWPAEWQKWIRRAAKFAAERRQHSNVVALPGAAGRRMSTTDQRVQQALDVAAELRALEEGNTA